MGVISLLLGVGRSYPLITGLLFLSLMGMGWSYWKGAEHTANRYKVEKSKAIEKDAKENREILKDAHEDEIDHQTTVTKSKERLRTKRDEILNLPANSCLDVKLSDLGLR